MKSGKERGPGFLDFAFGLGNGSWEAPRRCTVSNTLSLLNVMDMTEENTIRVCFWTPEPDFGEVVGRALGDGFQVRFEESGKAAASACQDGS